MSQHLTCTTSVATRPACLRSFWTLFTTSRASPSSSCSLPTRRSKTASTSPSVSPAMSSAVLPSGTLNSRRTCAHDHKRHLRIFEPCPNSHSLVYSNSTNFGFVSMLFYVANLMQKLTAQPRILCTAKNSGAGCSYRLILSAQAHSEQCQEPIHCLSGSDQCRRGGLQ